MWQNYHRTKSVKCTFVKYSYKYSYQTPNSKIEMTFPIILSLAKHFKAQINPVSISILGSIQ